MPSCLESFTPIVCTSSPLTTSHAGSDLPHARSLSCQKPSRTARRSGCAKPASSFAHRRGCSPVYWGFDSPCYGDANCGALRHPAWQTASAELTL